MTNISPALSAMMCDGMGWFAETDYKKILLSYDRVYYLLPEESVEFRDVDGSAQNIVFPPRLRPSPHFVVHSFRPAERLAGLLRVAAGADAEDPNFAAEVGRIPAAERLYTWRVTNCDGDVGGGRSPGIGPGEDALAHAVLLNKFLLAADSASCIPITGKPYIHSLLSVKYRRAVDNLSKQIPEALSFGLRENDVRHDAVLQSVVSALVPDEELESRSFEEILEFKSRHRPLFERFSRLMHSLIGEVRSLPSDRTFSRDVAEMINNEVWEKKTAVESEIRNAWRDVFGSGVKESVRSELVGNLWKAGLSGVALGVVPSLTLGSLTMAAVLGPAVAGTSWAVSEAIDYFRKRKALNEHGLYYLMRFAR